MGELTWHAAAAANILEARKKKGRIVSRKSRTGCLTCKARRIKCDEIHPECRNCINSGRNCGGYLDGTSPKANSKASHSLIGQHLSQSLGLKENEKRTFDYFLSWTAPHMAGPLDKEFWCGQVLQVAHTEPIILDALLALSILYEHPQFMKSFYHPRTSTEQEEQYANPKFQNGVVNIAKPTMSQPPPVDAFHACALLHYNRAIKRFKQRMDEGTATQLLAILSCLLFIGIELIRDNVFGALTLFTQGIKLLRGFEPDGNIETSLYMSVKLMFARIALLTALFGHSGRVDISEELTNIDCEKGFADVSHARTSLFALTTEVHDCIRDASEFTAGPNVVLPRTNFVDDYPSQVVHPGEDRGRRTGVTRLYYGCVDDETTAPDLQMTEDDSQDDIPPPPALASIPWYHPSPQIIERRTQLNVRLRQWLDAFKMSPSSHTEDEATTSLLMQYYISTIWLRACLSPFETTFDQSRWEFKEVLRLAEIFTRCKNERPTFTLEAGVVPHLYFVATKCRVPSMRRRAIDLMHKAPLKEAMHGSCSIAEFASRLITIEESGIQPPLSPPGPLRSGSQSPPIDDSILPPESKRIHHIEILRNRPADRFEIRVTRYSYNATGERCKAVVDYPM